MRSKILQWFCMMGILFFCGNGVILFGVAVQDDIDPKGAFLLNSKTTYEHFCAPCHGEVGAGDGRYYPSYLSPSPRDFTNTTISSVLFSSRMRPHGGQRFDFFTASEPSLMAVNS